MKSWINEVEKVNGINIPSFDADWWFGNGFSTLPTIEVRSESKADYVLLIGASQVESYEALDDEDIVCDEGIYIDEDGEIEPIRKKDIAIVFVCGERSEKNER